MGKDAGMFEEPAEGLECRQAAGLLGNDFTDGAVNGGGCLDGVWLGWMAHAVELMEKCRTKQE